MKKKNKQLEKKNQPLNNLRNTQSFLEKKNNNTAAMFYQKQCTQKKSVENFFYCERRTSDPRIPCHSSVATSDSTSCHIHVGISFFGLEVSKNFHTQYPSFSKKSFGRGGWSVRVGDKHWWGHYCDNVVATSDPPLLCHDVVATNDPRILCLPQKFFCLIGFFLFCLGV
jgi:hypothetical protein